MQLHRWQPTRLLHPWDSPGKNTGVDCHFLLQCMKVKSKSEVAQSCLTVHDPMDCSPPWGKEKLKLHYKKSLSGTSAAGQWLELCFPMNRVWVLSLVRKLRCHMPHGQKNEKENKQYCSKFNFLKRKTKKKSLVVAGGGCGMIKYDNQLLLWFLGHRTHRLSHWEQHWQNFHYLGPFSQALMISEN